ncbi:hypothetical protein JAAARDRAFT_116588 [Jaapia argillacea MUCL 33604]|uniref:Mitochondrial inner membrane protease subunit 2 n=1 Tax=Jaapia argillacea MUCL 33604 TaxID=933084 RepID=A0A067QFF5_9AGAM|nr:hypothetical protein JAAARDRAFT_116588 [Jaapia argillacea MUCL 33604]
MFTTFRHQWLALHKSWRCLLQTNPALRWPLVTLYWLPTGIVFSKYFYSLRSVKGMSMQPTLNPDISQWRDVVLLDHYSTRVKGLYRRGDVVTVWSPMEPGVLLIKRIIALGGDKVKTLPPYPDTEITVPEGHAWVEGDEPFRSDDSNKFGPVPLALLDSRLLLIVWPFARIGFVPHPSEASVKSPRGGPAWRQEKAETERHQWRTSRVTVGPNS